MFKDLDLEAHPGLLKLLKEGETLEDFLKQSKDKILIRWFNYHLERSELDHDPITNLGKDVADGTAYTVLLNQLDKSRCDATGLEDDEDTRCQKVLDNAEEIGATKFLTTPHEITCGNKRLNMLFTASIYNAKPGLEDVDEREAYAKIINYALKDDPICAPDVPINPDDDSLFESLDNGIVLWYMLRDV